MSILEAIFLGIVQGATEFLPVSSSGHSVLLPYIFGVGETSLVESAIAHLGTLLAVLIYFRKDVLDIINGVIQGLLKRDPLGIAESRLGWFIVLGSFPAAIAGLLFEDQFESIFGGPRSAAFFLIITAVLLVLGERMLSGKKNIAGMTWVDALIIGVFQMFALFPGVSRSGSTIVGALTRGLSRELGARYSFLMSIPVIAGAGLLKVIDLLQMDNLGDLIVPMTVLFFTSAAVGYLCIAFLMNWIKQRSLYPFAIYCAGFGIGFLAFSFVFG